LRNLKPFNIQIGFFKGIGSRIIRTFNSKQHHTVGGIKAVFHKLSTKYVSLCLFTNPSKNQPLGDREENENGKIRKIKGKKRQTTNSK